MEIWKDVKGYEGAYQVSNLGRVKSFKCNKERVLKQSIGTTGYYRVCLSNKITEVKSVHILVAIAFLNHVPSGYKLVVNHKDINPFNNNVDNLELITQRENANKKHLKSSSQYTGVCWDKSSKKWMAYIRIKKEKRKYLGLFINEYDAHLAYEKALKEIL